MAREPLGTSQSANSEQPSVMQTLSSMEKALTQAGFRLTVAEWIEGLQEALREAIDYMPDGYTDCAGYKCRQPNCQACWSEPEDGTVRKEKLKGYLMPKVSA